MGELLEDTGDVQTQWPLQSVDDVKAKDKGALISGPFGSNISAKYFTESGVPVIRGNNLALDVGVRFKDEGFAFITDDKAEELRTWAQAGDLIFTAVGTIGQVGYLAGNEAFPRYIISNKQIRLRLDTGKLIPLFAYYWFSSPQMVDLIQQRNTGSSVPLINLGVVRSLPVPVPDIKVQESITEVLSSLDAKIDLLHRQNRTLEAMAGTLFRQWFVEKAEEGWPQVQLGDHIQVHRGLSYNGAGLCGPDEGVPMHNLNSVYEGGGYKYDGIKYYKGEYKDRHVIKAGELIMTNTEQGHEHLLIGCPAIIPKSFGDKGIFSQHVYRIAMLNPLFTSVFVKHLVMTSDMREQIAGATNGSTVNMLPKDGIEMAKFQMPPDRLIKQFNEYALPMHEKMEENQVQIESLIALRDTLLPKLMSGEVRVEETLLQ